MLRTISGDKDLQRAGARRRFPARRLHLVDIENLAGDSLPSLGQVREVQDLYTGCLGVSAVDQVVIASSHLTWLATAWCPIAARPGLCSGWSGARLLVPPQQVEHDAGHRLVAGDGVEIIACGGRVGTARAADRD
jgi:hypothetical protein